MAAERVAAFPAPRRNVPFTEPGRVLEARVSGEAACIIARRLERALREPPPCRPHHFMVQMLDALAMGLTGEQRRRIGSRVQMLAVQARDPDDKLAAEHLAESLRLSS